MKKATVYRQCELVRLNEGGTGVLKDVSWIPASFAKLGKTLSLKNSQGEWVEGWVVRAVGGSKKIEELQAQEAGRGFFSDKVECKRDRKKERD